MKPISSSNLLFPCILVAVSLATMGLPALTASLPDSPPAVAIPNSSPSPCFGLVPVDGRWHPSQRECPANHALFSVGDEGGKERPGNRINVSSTCCPLPSADILTDVHVFAWEECPVDHVVTGASEQRCEGDHCPVLMRCTKINTERYLTGKSTPGLYWGHGHAGWRNSIRIEREDIPLGIRYSVGRSVDDSYPADGCVGYPFGSLLTKKTSKYCGGFGFRRLQFRGSAGDPIAGTPVKMFEDCSAVTKNETNSFQCDSLTTAKGNV